MTPPATVGYRAGMDAVDLAQISRIRTMCRNGQIQAIRLGANITQRELADAVGRDPATVSRWEGGNRMPSSEDALRLAELLNQLEST